MLLVPPNAKNMATGAIRPPIIVDLPEFAPVFPTTARLRLLFDASNANKIRLFLAEGIARCRTSNKKAA